MRFECQTISNWNFYKLVVLFLRQMWAITNHFTNIRQLHVLAHILIFNARKKVELNVRFDLTDDPSATLFLLYFNWQVHVTFCEYIILKYARSVRVLTFSSLLIFVNQTVGERVWIVRIYIVYLYLPQATLAFGSCCKWASNMASLIWSHILSKKKKHIIEKYDVRNIYGVVICKI